MLKHTPTHQLPHSGQNQCKMCNSINSEQFINDVTQIRDFSVALKLLFSKVHKSTYHHPPTCVMSFIDRVQLKPV